MFKYTLHFLVFVFLTVLTQLGGIVYLLAFYLAKRLRLSTFKAVILFISFYLFASLVSLPFVAPMFGRTALPIFGKLSPLNIGTCLLNRHYVRPELMEQLILIAEQMDEQFEGTQTHYLDASFPFYDGFPLLPHLSHDDGRKVDLAFYYTHVQSGEASNSTPSFMGYGIYDGPREGELNYPKRCAEQGYWQYALLSYVMPQWKKDDFKVDVKRSSTLLKLLAEDQLTSKLFLEPHLKERWGLSTYQNIRFHGCQAVRHDDHIHLQIR